MIVYRYIDEFINIILYIFNFFSRCSMIFRPKIRKLLKHNRELKKMRNSDECFIIGNGPSLKRIDLKKIEDKDTFTVNYFYKYREDGFKSRFFVAVDDGFAKTEGLSYIKKLHDENKDMFMILRHSCYFNSNKKLSSERSFFLYAKQFQTGNDVRICCDKNMTACINVVLQCIQVALYMGYKKIYLLGCDFNEYAKINIEHFYDAKLTRIYSKGDEARWAALAHYHHYALQKYAEKNGIEIVNLTIDSLIDAYKKMNYEDAI